MSKVNSFAASLISNVLLVVLAVSCIAQQQVLAGGFSQEGYIEVSCLQTEMFCEGNIFETGMVIFSISAQKMYYGWYNYKNDWLVTDLPDLKLLKLIKNLDLTPGLHFIRVSRNLIISLEVIN